MHRAIQTIAIAIAASFAASFAGISGAAAAPQILAVLATAEPVPLTCTDGVCEAEFSTMCLQREREMPQPGTAYAPADADNIVVVVRRADGTEARIAGHPGLRFSVPRTYVSATASISEAELRRLGATSAAVEIGPLASLVPAPQAGDTDPLTAEEIVSVTGPLRMAAERAVKRERDTIAAARLTNRITNALIALPTASGAERLDLWDRIASGEPAGTGVQKARRIFDVCQDYADKQGEEGFRGCLQFRHDYLMFGINHTYWHRNDVGS